MGPQVVCDDVSELSQEDFSHHDAFEMNGREGERIRGDILIISQ